MNHEPNGASTKSILHYAQNMREDRFQEYSDTYNKVVPIGQDKHTDLIPIDTITKVPIAFFRAAGDKLADKIDTDWTANTIGDAVVHDSTMNGGHLTFMIGRDMTFFNDVMNIIDFYTQGGGKDGLQFLQ